MKEIIRDEKKFYELKEQDLIRLHTRLRLVYECVDDIFTDYEDFDPSTIAALTDIKNQVTEARDILKVTEGHYTIKKSSARHEKEIGQLEKELNGINAVQGGHRLELDGLNRKLDQIRVDVNKNRRALTELRDADIYSLSLEETTDESIEDRLSKLEKRMNAVGLRSMTNNNCK